MLSDYNNQKKTDYNFSSILEQITNLLKIMSDPLDIYNTIVWELFSVDQKRFYNKEFKVFIQTGGKLNQDYNLQKTYDDIACSKKFKIMKGKLYESVPVKQHRFDKEIYNPKYTHILD